MATFQFSGFTLQTARPGDNHWKIARAWTQADPSHRDTTSPSFWFEQEDGIESYVLEDRGGVVFFFKMMRRPNAEVELHIQFPPKLEDAEKDAEQRDRVMRGLTLGLQWIEKVLASREVSRLFFSSKSPSLIRFSQKRLGFKLEQSRLVKQIYPTRGIASGAGNGN